MKKLNECKVSKIPVSDNTISRRVDDLSNNFSGILSEILQNNNFALQVDETTDITGKAQLLAFVRFENEDEIMENSLNFALQVDETTDITGKAQLLAFVRFENEDEIMENFLCCKKALPETTKGHDIFNILSSFKKS